MSWWSRVGNVFRSGHVERDLDEELQFHLDERIRALTAAGLTPEEAAAEARRRFGSPLRMREQSRDVKLLPWLDSLLRDVRLGTRMLRRNAAVTATAVVSLSLALGACVSAFALLDALIFRTLPVKSPDQLVYLAFPTYTSERPEADTFSDPLFLQLRDAGRAQVDLFAMSTQVIRPVTFAGAADKERVRTQYVSGSAFDTLGVASAAGRLLSPHDDRREAEPVVVISHAFWLRRFGGDPAAIGQTLAVENRIAQIVGVAGASFPGVEPGRPTDLWLPYSSYNPRAFGNGSFNWFRIFGRIRDGVAVAQAQSALQAAFASYRRDRAPRTGPDESANDIARYVGTPLYLRSAANGPSPLRRQFERSLWILGAIAALVLIIAGSNVANLFLARTAAREREMALRLSIGAARGRLVQQMLVESALVATAACAIGLLFATAVGPAVVTMLATPDDPVYLDLSLNWRLLAASAGLTCLTTAVFGIVPALRASGVAPIAALKTGGNRSGLRGGAMRPFVAVQVAFGLVVLFVGGLLVLSFARVSSVDPGFAAADVLLVGVEPTEKVDPQRQRAALVAMLDRLRDVPGVQAVSSAEYSALGRAWTHYVRPPGTAREAIEVTMAPVMPGFLETMRIPILAGREFVAADTGAGTLGAVVVNEAFASRYFGGAPAVGRTVDALFGDPQAPRVHEVVGVAADTKYDLHKPAVPTIYIPLRLNTTGTLHVRVAGDQAALLARLREEVRATIPPFRVTSVTSQATAIGRTLLRERLLALLAGFFALVGLILIAVGLYGVLSYSVAQRTREIGIRVALGAPPLAVIRSIAADTGLAALVGGVCGMAVALYAARFVKTLLFEVSPLDFWSLALPVGVFCIATIAAATIPARRVTRVDPVNALRCE